MKGITIVELIVVTAIIAIMSAIILPNFGTIRNQLLLERCAHRLSQDIRKAGEMAMSAQMSGSEVPAGYGIFIEENATSYLFYSDSPPPNGNEKYDSGEEFETVNLELGVKVESVSPAGSSANPSFSVNFRPPNPLVKIFGAGDALPSSNAIVILSLVNDPTKTKTIRINSAGLVDVD